MIYKKDYKKIKNFIKNVLTLILNCSNMTLSRGKDCMGRHRKKDSTPNFQDWLAPH